MTEYRSLRELDEAHDEARAHAAQRMELAEDCVNYFRSRMSQLQDDFATLAHREGFAEDPGFQAEMRSVAGRTDESVWEAGRVLARFEEEDDDRRFRERLEREEFIEQHRERP